MPSYTFTPSILRGAGTRAVPEIPAGSSSTFLVDQFSTNIFGAYSLRKLSSTYTGSAIQVQIGSSGATFNAGFDSNGYLDTASIAAFNTASAQLFLENWYDQSGNVNNMDGNQTGRRLQVTDVSGSFFTSSNGNIRLYMNESSKGNQYINNVASSFPASGSVSLFGIYFNDQSVFQNYEIVLARGTDTTLRPIVLRSDMGSGIIENKPTNVSQNEMISTTTLNTSSINSISFIANQNPGITSLFSNTALAVTSSTFTIPEINLFAFPDLSGTAFASEPMEWIIYNADKTSDRVAIETNQNDFYNFSS